MDTSAVRNLGVLSTLNYAKSHAEKLQAHPIPAIAERAVLVRDATADLESAYAATRPLRALWSGAAKTKNEADDALDDAVSSLSYDLLAPTRLNGDRDARDYRALFPDGNIKFIYGPDRAELVQVGAIATYLEKTPTHPMADRAAVLRQKAAVMEAALGPATAAESAYLGALAIQRDRKAALVRVVAKNVRFLRDQLNGDEAKVNALFPTIAEATTKEDPEP